MKSMTCKITLIVTILTTSCILGGIAFANEFGDPPSDGHREHMERKHDPRMNMMTEVLGLSEAQQKQIRDIQDKERAGMEETMQKMRTGDKKMKALLESAVFDESAIRSLAKSQEALKTELFVAHAKTEYQISQLLTPEQRELKKKLNPLMHQGEMQPPPRPGN